MQQRSIFTADAEAECKKNVPYSLIGQQSVSLVRVVKKMELMGVGPYHVFFYILYNVL